MVIKRELRKITEGYRGYVRGTAFFKRQNNLWMSAKTQVFSEPKEQNIFLVQRGFNAEGFEFEPYVVAFKLPSQGFRCDESYPTEAIRVFVYDFLDPFRKEQIDIYNLEQRIIEAEKYMIRAAENQNFLRAAKLKGLLEKLQKQLSEFPIIRFFPEGSLALQQ